MTHTNERGETADGDAGSAAPTDRHGDGVDRDGSGSDRNGDGVGRDGSGSDGDGDDAGVECPFCGSTDVEKDSDFGPEISKSQYYCNACRTPFERIKFGGSRRPETGR